MGNTLAVIDCGTNTFNLLIVEEHEGEMRQVFSSKLPVKIGAGGFQERRIQPKRMLRALDALLCHHSNCINFGCNPIFAFATSAIRDAQNQDDFLQHVKQKIGLQIHVLSGEQEAEWIARGVRKSMTPTEETALIMDIGGGSVEFIITRGERNLWKASYNIGVSRLHEAYFKSDVSYTKGLGQASYFAEFMDEIQKTTAPLLEALAVHRPTCLIGSSGSFDTLLDLFQEKIVHPNDTEEICSEIPITHFQQTHQWMMKSKLEERYMHPLIPAIRAEYMPIATVLIDFTLRKSGIQRLLHSPHSLKEGLLDALLCGELNYNSSSSEGNA
ncbi:MAG: hypothetical protein ACKO6L_04295 [Flavobacteriales bacterium]